jgi:hypothetical protein
MSTQIETAVAAALPPFRGALPKAASPSMHKAWAATAAAAKAAELVRAGWPTGICFEDDPTAIAEPRGPSGWNGAAHAIDLTGKRFGKLLVIARTAGQTRQGAFWSAVCDCGGEAIVKSSHLRSGHSTSCGCVKRSKQFQPGSNEPPTQSKQQPIFTDEQLIRDALLIDMHKRMARQAADGGRGWFVVTTDGSRDWERRLRNRISWHCRHIPEVPGSFV